MNNKVIIDIYYQDLNPEISSFSSKTRLQIFEEKKKELFKDGFQPYFAPLIGKYETSSFSYQPYHYQTWVKYKS